MSFFYKKNIVYTRVHAIKPSIQGRDYKNLVVTNIIYIAWCVDDWKFLCNWKLTFRDHLLNLIRCIGINYLNFKVSWSF